MRKKLDKAAKMWYNIVGWYKKKKKNKLLVTAAAALMKIKWSRLVAAAAS